MSFGAFDFNRKVTSSVTTKQIGDRRLILSAVDFINHGSMFFHELSYPIFYAFLKNGHEWDPLRCGYIGYTNTQKWAHR